MPIIKIIKGTVDKLTHPSEGQKLFMDDALKGFGVLISANTKSYVAQRDIGGRTVRVTLGRHGVMTTAQARRYAEEALGLMRRGINPNEQKRAAQGRSITLQEAADLYLQSNKPRAEKTIKGSIPAEQLGALHKDTQALPNPIRRDFYLFILFTGLRRKSAAEIRWEHADLDKGMLLIPKPKGGTKRAFTLPLSDLPIEILRRRQSENEKLTPNSPWAFPSDQSKTGHIVEPKLTPAQKASMVVPFNVHGLRHTWITAANAAGLSPYDIKMLTNHMLPKGDVTAGYIGLHMEALRASQQRVTDYLRSLI
jgi:integrase